MKKKVMLQIIITLIVSTFLISCDKGVPNLVNQNVVLASGVNFKTNEFVVINPKNEKEVQPCGKTIIIEKNNSTAQGPYQSNPSSTGAQNNEPCNNQIVEPSEALLNALRIINPIKGFIIKDGKKIEARFFVSVKALYKGSHCNSDYLNGDAYTLCLYYEGDPF